MKPLPIDPLLPQVKEAARDGALVLVAPPGAGKTTRVPVALLELGLPGEIVVLQPRRLPARLAARRVAEELGEEPGRRVGYTVRFEDVSSRETRVRFVTEGVLTRRLLSDPELPGVSAVVLDEFHERHLATDLALALVQRLRRSARPDLALVVMSATMDPAPVAAYLDAPVLRSEGRAFPVAIEHAERESERPLAEQVSFALKRLVREGLDGHVLVFLPGAGEIRRAAEVLEPFAREHGIELLPLHGDLPLAEQARAVEPRAARAVILSTNVAETSVTVEGVAAVIDSGLARVAAHDPWSGLPSLQVAKISQASAAQRAGRAGRTREGRALRLYTRADHDARPSADLPEVRRLDLADTALALHAAGLRDPAALEWLEAPSPAGLDAARALLEALGAVSGGVLTDTGRRMLRFPVHPRLARLVVEGERRGVGKDAAAIAALAGERDVRLSARAFGGARGGDRSGPSDLLDMLERLREVQGRRLPPQRLRSLGLDPGAVDAVDRAARQLSRLVKDAAPAPRGEARDPALQLAILAGFPDRVAKRRRPRSREIVLAGGGAGELDEASVVHEATFLVAVEATTRGRRAPSASSPAGGPFSGMPLVRTASAIEPEWLIELMPGRIVETDELVLEESSGRVMQVSRMAFGQIALDETVKPATPSEATSRVLAQAVIARGLGDRSALEALRARMEVLARAAPELGIAPPTPAGEEEALRAACDGLRSLGELAEVDLAALVIARLPPERRAALDREAPARVTLPGGRSVAVSYEAGREAWIESRLQDFFGMARGPAIARGRVPLTLHLLAPSGRAVQVTQDLAGFWERHYPQLRRELMRRYPRHAWPEDGRNAAPPAPNRRR